MLSGEMYTSHKTNTLRLKPLFHATPSNSTEEELTVTFKRLPSPGGNFFYFIENKPSWFLDK